MPACTCLIQCSITTCSCCCLTQNLSLCALPSHTRLPNVRANKAVQYVYTILLTNPSTDS